MKLRGLVLRIVFVTLFINSYQYSFISAQNLPDSSNLPLIVINTSGAIVDEPKIVATMGIIDNGPGSYNRPSDAYNDYNGNIGIELRGSSSQFFFEKKNFGIELRTIDDRDTSASILGFPEEEDWVLHGPYSDKTLMRNFLTFHLWSKLGRYGSRTKFIELILNGSYHGVYLLMEKVKRDKNRVDISKLNPDENSGDDLTGGYIVKIDKFDGTNSGLGWASPYKPPNSVNYEQVIFYQFDYPKGRNITPSQSQYIEELVTEFEAVMAGPEFTNLQTGYRAYIDDDSFVDYMLINEITRNVDAYRLSTFLHKDRDSKNRKLVVGPIWDFNIALGNADYCEGSNTQGWAWDFNSICNRDFWLIPFWWKRFLSDPAFVAKMQSRWSELRSGPYATNVVLDYIDSVSNSLEDAQVRNFDRWSVIGRYIWPNSFVGQTYREEVSYLKTWLSDRLLWMDENIPLLQTITAIPDESDLFQLEVYPNPFHQWLEINATRDVEFIFIRDTMGRLLRKVSNEDPKISTQLNVSDIPEGLYILTVQFRSGNIVSKAIVKRH